MQETPGGAERGERRVWAWACQPVCRTQFMFGHSKLCSLGLDKSLDQAMFFWGGMRCIHMIINRVGPKFLRIAW